MDLETNEIEVYADTYEYSLNVPCSGKFKVYSDDEWISIPHNSIKGNGDEYTLHFEFSENKSGEDRTGVISISGKSIYKTLLVKQCARYTRNFSDFLKSVYSGSFSKVYICAHRANTDAGQKEGSCPENSVPAVEKCIEKGMDMIEIDVRETADGQLVCCHDAYIDKVTTGKGNVKDMTYDEICSYDMRMRNGTVVPGVKMALLKDILRVAKGRIWVNLDLAKTNISPSKTIDVVREESMLDEVTCYTGSSVELAKKYYSLSSKRLVPHVSVSVAGACGNFSGIEVQPLFQIGTAYYYDGQHASTELSSALRKEGYCSFSNLLCHDKLVQAGVTTPLEKFIDAKIDFLQTDFGDSYYVNKVLKEHGLR